MSYNITIEKVYSTENPDWFKIRTQYGTDVEESYLDRPDGKWAYHDLSSQTSYSWDQVELKSVHFGILSYCFSVLTNLTDKNKLTLLDRLEYGIVNNYSNTTVNFKGF